MHGGRTKHRTLAPEYKMWLGLGNMSILVFRESPIWLNVHKV